MGFLRKKKSKLQSTLPAPMPAATDYKRKTEKYPNEVGVLSEALSQGVSTTDFLRKYLERLPAESDPRDFFASSAPFVSATLGTTPAARYLEDFKNLENPLQAYGQGAGMIGQGAAQGLQSGQNQLARSGLGRSSAMAGLAQRATQGAANAQSGLYTDLFQATQQKQAMNAQRAFDLQRQIAQMALGQSMLPRDGGGSGISQGAAIGSGALSGAGTGFAIGGPIGAVIGGLGGGILGAFS